MSNIIYVSEKEFGTQFTRTNVLNVSEKECYFTLFNTQSFLDVCKFFGKIETYHDERNEIACIQKCNFHSN